MISAIRTIYHDDGSFELLRATPRLAEPGIPEDPLPYESSLLWLLPLESLDYVRIAIIHQAKTRSGPLALKNDVVLVGYSKLADDAPPHPRTKGFTRRVFYLTLEDARRNMNDVPPTAVDPASLVPGQAGSPPNVASFELAYPRHARRRRRSLLRKPVEIGPILASNHGLQLAAS